MKIGIPFLALTMLSAYCATGQDTLGGKSPSKESHDYDLYRLQSSYPPYGLQKVQEMVRNLKLHDDTVGFGAKRTLSQKAYLSLSLREKFTYHMIFPESYSQNCSMMPPIPDEQDKIFAELPEAFGEYNWSDRQTKFFLANRDSVIQLMRECIAKDKQVGLNFKHVIVDISAREMIPLLISFYNGDKRDHDLLTVLMLLMSESEYDQFLLSASYKKLYADPDASYKSFLIFNTANEALILKRATDFYNGLHP